MPIQVSIAHELMKLCTNLRECHIRLEKNWESLPPIWIKSHPLSTIRVPYLRILEIHQEDTQYVTRVFNDFLRPLVIPNLQRFDFSLEADPEQNMVPTLTELAAIVHDLSRHSLVSELVCIGESGLAEVISALPFVTFLHASGSILTPMIQMMARKDLPKLTSLETQVAYGDMDAFINMLETRWVGGMEARQSGCSNACIIRSARIYIVGAPSPNSVSRLSRKIREIRDRLKVKGCED